MTLDYPSLGLGLIMGSVGLLLAGLWLQVCRLSARVQKRDRRIESLLAVDRVTGLINRQRFCSIGQQLIDQKALALLDKKALPTTSSAQKTSESAGNSDIAVLVLNIDQFTSVNDCFGHPAGDNLLCQVGDRLQQRTRRQDTLARTGDDEFAILLNPGTRERVDAAVTAIMRSLHEPFAIRPTAQSPHQVYVRSRLGVARQTIHASSQRESAHRFTHLLSQASMAMAYAKSEQYRGSNQDWQSRIVRFRPEMATQLRSHSQRQRLLRHAIDQQELRVHYQPIVDLKTALTVGFEALVRWQHPEEGLLCPSAFLPLSDAMGLTVNIDRWVLKQVCQQLQVWKKRGRYPYVSVNLSGPHLDRADLVDHIQYMLTKYAVSPQQLNMEITESVMITDPQRAINTLRQLRQLGLRVSLDDFGTGYSSLGYLQQFPVDVLKIDRSFVKRLGRATNRRNKQDEFIVQSILSLAKGLNIRVVAEGIERDDQYLRLKQMHCSYGQGHFFSKPVQPILADDFLIEEMRA